MLMRALSVHIAHETAGAARIRHSLRPLYFRGRRLLANLGRNAPRECEVAFTAVIVREGGRSSIPETPMIDPRGRSVLDAPPSRGMTATCDSDERQSLRRLRRLAKHPCWR